MAGRTAGSSLLTKTAGPQRKFNVVTVRPLRGHSLAALQLHVSAEDRRPGCATGIRDLTSDLDGELGVCGIRHGPLVTFQRLRHLDDTCRVVVGERCLDRLPSLGTRVPADRHRRGRQLGGRIRAGSGGLSDHAAASRGDSIHGLAVRAGCPLGDGNGDVLFVQDLSALQGANSFECEGAAFCEGNHTLSRDLFGDGEAAAGDIARVDGVVLGSFLQDDRGRSTRGGVRVGVDGSV